MTDPMFWVSPAIAFIFCFFYHFIISAKNKRLTESNEYFHGKMKIQTEIISGQRKERDELNRKLKALESQKPKNSQELVDFMLDLKTNGYGVVRIDPDSIFYRGTR
jgi:hypothetical protein